MAYGDFDFRLVLGSARPALASAGADADGLSSAGIQPLFRCGRPALKSDRVVFQGPKNVQSSRALARDMATLSVKQTKGGESRPLVYRALGGFHFNDAGQAYKAFMLDEATCAPLEIEVKVGRSRKAQKLAFACDEAKPEAGGVAKDAKGGQAGGSKGRGR